MPKGLLAGVLPDGSGTVLSRESLGRYRDVFGERLSLLLEFPREGDDRVRLLRARELSQATGVPLAAANDVHYHVPARQPLHDCLVALRHNTSVAQGRARGMAVREQPPQPAPRRRMGTIVRRGPRGAGSVARAIAEQCRFSLDELRYEYPEELAPAGRSPFEFLCELTWRGARERWRGAAAARNFTTPGPIEAAAVDPAERLPVAPPDVRRRVPSRIVALLEHELRLIADLSYEAYFLTVVGPRPLRAGAADSLSGARFRRQLRRLLLPGVTSVDPDRIDVLFERFISRERNEAPISTSTSNTNAAKRCWRTSTKNTVRERTGMTAEVITYRSLPPPATSARLWGWSQVSSTDRQKPRRSRSGGEGGRGVPRGGTRSRIATGSRSLGTLRVNWRVSPGICRNTPAAW